MISDSTKNSNPTPFKKVAECLYRHHKSGIYYGLVKRSGKQFRKSFKTTDRKLAERLLTDFRQKVTRLSLRRNVSSITFLELGRHWAEIAKMKLKPNSKMRIDISTQMLTTHFGIASVRSIDTAACHEWEKARSADVGASSFNADRGVLVRILDYAIREGLLLDNPAIVIPRRKMPKHNLTIPTREQYQKLVAQLRKTDSRAESAADLVELLAYSGMRLTEAVNLNWSDVDFERATFAVTGGDFGTKNHEARMVPLFPALEHLLKSIHKRTQPSSSGHIIPINSAKKAMGTACRKAGLPRFHHHLLRHYFVSNAIEAGVDFKVIANWVGHKDGGVLVAKTYGHLRDTHSFEMAKRMTFGAVLTSA